MLIHPQYQIREVSVVVSLMASKELFSGSINSFQNEI